MKRYFMDSDDSGHWYIIDADKVEEWRRWQDLDEDDEESWEVPDYASRLDGHPSSVWFENPIRPQ